jgi:parallel beta-helix repeat protein
MSGYRFRWWLWLVVLLVGTPARAQVEIPVGQAWQPIIDAHPAGTTFLIKAGVHRGQQVRPRTGDTFLGERRGGILVSIWSGARVLSGWQRDGSAWFVGGQTQEGRHVNGAGICWSTHPRCDRPEDLFFDNVMRRHVDARAAVAPGTWFFDYAADRIYVGDDPNGHHVETSVLPYVFQSYPYGVTNVTIDSLIIEKFATPSGEGAVNLGHSAAGSVEWMIRNSRVRWNHGGGIQTDAMTYAIGNDVHHNCGSGMVGAGWDIVIEGNEISYNNIAAGAAIVSWSVNGSNATCGYNAYWSAGGSKWVYTTNLVVRGNRVHHNDGNGLWTDINNRYTLYEGNVVFENAGTGIFHEISYDATIRKNTVKRNGLARDFPWWTSGAGIQVASSPNVEIYENVVEDNAQAITGLNDHRGAGIYGPWSLTNMLVRDNVVRYTSPPAAGWGQQGVVETQGVEAFTVASNNRYEQNTYDGHSPSYVWNGFGLSANAWHGNGQDVENATGGGPPATSRSIPLALATFVVSALVAGRLWRS